MAANGRFGPPASARGSWTAAQPRQSVSGIRRFRAMMVTPPRCSSARVAPSIRSASAYSTAGQEQRFSASRANLAHSRRAPDCGGSGVALSPGPKEERMRISFDVDDTLVCGPAVPTEQFVPWWRRWWYPERLRLGTRDLMRALVQQRHTLWIYTTSYRPRRYLRRWFASF